MGAEAACTVKFGRKTSSGKALLETHEIVFRGDEFRLKIPFDQISALDAKAGKLRVTYPDGTATFDLGAKAEQWADKICDPKSVIDKLGMKPSYRVSVLNVHAPEFVRGLRDRVDLVSQETPVKESDAIFLGADTLEGLDEVPQLLPYMKGDGAIWTVTPKGKGGVKDTDIMARMKFEGLVAVKVVAFSATHSANKFVVPVASRTG